MRLSRLYEPQADPCRARTPWFVPVATLILYLLWRGYGYGYSDQDEIIPYLLHLLDPSLLTSDWFVAGQAEAFGPRTLFVWLVYVPARLFGLYATILAIYIVSWLLIAQAVQTLGFLFTGDRLAAAGGVVLALLLTPKFTLGGNDLVAVMLIPSMAGWAFGLWGVVQFVRARYVACALLLGLAAWTQALIGLHLALILGALLLIKSGRSRPREVLIFAGLYALAALPSLGPLIAHQWSSAPVEGGPSLFYMLFEFRAPHHYLFTSFTRISALGFVLLMLFGLGGFRRLGAEHRPFVARLLLCIGLGCLVGFLGTEVFRLGLIGKLQFFKLTVLAKVILAILLCNVLSSWIPASVRSVFDPLFDHSAYAFGATLLLGATLLIASPNALGLRQEPITEESPPVERIEEWARTQTAPDMIFAVPPSWSGFRSRAQRAIVINYKAFPFRKPRDAEWFERLTSLAPIQLPERGFFGIQDSLDAAFLNLPASRVRSLRDRYGFDYAVRRRAANGEPSDFIEAFSAGDWKVYRISPDSLSID